MKNLQCEQNEEKITGKMNKRERLIEIELNRMENKTEWLKKKIVDE